jgi:D-alanine-D-alanine ligase and related ATP-grasp enzymes
MTVLLIYGGKSVEHEVSEKSAAFIRQNLIEAGHSVKDLYVTKEGAFVHEGKKVLVEPPFGFVLEDGSLIEADTAFLMMHGAYGEDGRMQSLLELLNLPYVSTDSCSSMLGMHKSLQNRLYREAGLPIIPYAVFTKNNRPSLSELFLAFGYNLILKPEAGGSSVGVFLLRNPDKSQFEAAFEKVLELDDKVLVQPFLSGVRELMLAVYETEEGISTAGPGMIENGEDFLNYDQKYDADKHTPFITNPTISSTVKKEARELAVKVFKTLGCSIYARVDLFYWKGALYINEINTIPGFTEFSYYPALIRENPGIAAILNLMLGRARTEYDKRQAVNHSHE